MARQVLAAHDSVDPAKIVELVAVDGALKTSGGGGGGGDASEATLATRLSQADFDTRVGALTETAPATDTASSGVNGRLQRIAQRLTTLVTGIVLAAGSARIGKITVRNAADAADIDPLAEGTFTGRIGEVQASPTANTVLDRLKALLTGIVVAAGENHIGQVAGRVVTSAVTLTRPSDTTAYAAKDAVSNSTSAPSVLTFAGAGRVNAGSGYITSVWMMTDQSANVAQFRLHLYAIAPTAINDNGAQTILWANRTKRVGYADIGPVTTEGSGSDAANGFVSDLRIPFKCDTGDTNLYGLLETLSVFTPASAQNFYLSLAIDQN